MKNKTALKLIEDLIKAEPAKAANVFENLELKESLNVFKELSLENKIKCINYMDNKYASNILLKLNTETIKEIFQKLEKYKLVSIIKNTNEHKVKNLIKDLDKEIKSSLFYIFDYPKNSAGRIMYPDFISLNKNLTVEETSLKLKNISKVKELKSYIYVLDEENRLCGVLNIRDILISPNSTKIENIMIKQIIKVSPYTSKEELIKIFSAKNFISLPVTDSDGKMMGIIESKDIVEQAREESMEDLQLLLGSHPEEKIDSSFNFKFSKRIKWLLINLFTVFLSSLVIALFEKTLIQITFLAVIIPIIIGQGTASGTQTLSVLIRSLVMGEVDFKNTKKIFYSELLLGLLNGFICAFITALIFFLWKKDFSFSLVILISITLNTLIATISGAFIPLFMRKIDIDPAHSSIVILTTITDITGLFLLLFLGKIFIL